MDEDGALVIRKSVDFGKTHFEYGSVEHVWAIVATPARPRTTRGSESDNNNNDLLQPIILVFRPSHASLIEGKSTCLMWTPWQSLSISQRIYAKSSQKTFEVKEEDVKIQPCIHIQLLESSIKEGNFSTADAKVLEEENGKLTRKPLRTSRPMATNNLQKSKKLTGRHKEEKD